VQLRCACRTSMIPRGTESCKDTLLLTCRRASSLREWLTGVTTSDLNQKILSCLRMNHLHGNVRWRTGHQRSGCDVIYLRLHVLMYSPVAAHVSDSRWTARWRNPHLVS
jgi:hypothetical protein